MTYTRYTFHVLHTLILDLESPLHRLSDDTTEGFRRILALAVDLLGKILVKLASNSSHKDISNNTLIDLGKILGKFPLLEVVHLPYKSLGMNLIWRVVVWR